MNSKFLETLKTISTVLAAVLIPAIIGLTGHYVTQAIKEREIQGRFVELALDILKEPPDPETQNIRKWAVDIVNRYSGVPMNDPTKKDLIKRIPLAKTIGDRIYSNMMYLHPTLRGKVVNLLSKLHKENLPFVLFEGFRSPQRQQSLYEKGRTKSGSIVTKLRPWESLHNYGLSANLVIYKNNQWSWDPQEGYKRLAELAQEEGLRTLKWEPSHVLLDNVNIHELKQGKYPPGGDQFWAKNLSEFILNWDGEPKAPPLPKVE